MEGIQKLQHHLSNVPDFWLNRKKLYPLEEVLLLTILACICGLEEWEEAIDFGETRLDWLREFAPFDNGIPSHDTLNRVFCHLNHTAFCQNFSAWVVDLVGDRIKGLVPIDGKALRVTKRRIQYFTH